MEWDELLYFVGGVFGVAALDVDSVRSESEREIRTTPTVGAKPLPQLLRPARNKKNGSANAASLVFHSYAMVIAFSFHVITSVPRNVPRQHISPQHLQQQQKQLR